MTDGLVSVVMPSYNTARYIADSIRSVLLQSYESWELLIVDDGSEDDTAEIVGSFADPRIRYIQMEHGGAALARNRALREARGEWIAFLDSDDLWHPDKLRRQLDFMRSGGLVFSYHAYERIDEDGEPLHVLVSGPPVVTRRGMYRYDYPGCLTFMYSAKALGLIQIRDIPKNNDYALLLKLCKKADCYLLDENLAQYRVRKQSISHDRLLLKIKSHYDLFRVCEGRSAPAALWYAGRNMFFGVCKKLRYEKKMSYGT